MSLPTVIPTAPVVTNLPPASPTFTDTVPPVTPSAPIPPAEGLPDLSKAESLDQAIGIALEDAARKAEAQKTVPPREVPPATVPPSAPKAVEPGDLPDDAALDKEIAESTKSLGPKEREAFKTLRYEHRDMRRKLKEMDALQAKLAEVEKSQAAAGTPTEAAAAAQKDLEALRAKFEEAEKELSVTRLEATDYYKSKIATPLSELEIALEGVAKDYELKDTDIKSALSLTGKERAKALSELAEGMVDFDRKRFYDMVDHYGRLQAARVSALADAKTTYQQLQAAQKEESARASAERKAAWAKAAQEKWEKSILADAPFLAKQTGDAEWDSSVESAKKFAETVDYTELDLPSQTTVMHRAAAWPVLVGMTQGLQRQVDQLKLQLSEYKGATPSAGPSGVTAERKPAGTIADDVSWEDAISTRLAEAGLR